MFVYMKLQLIAFGIARDILKQRKLAVDLPEGSSIKSLKDFLVSEYPTFDELAKLDFAINEEYVNDGYNLQPGDEVVIIPPVSGG